jgi:hypothetical protein
MTAAMTSSIHHFIKHSVTPGAAENSNDAQHVLLIFDASGCVTKSDLAVVRSVAPAISSELRAEVSLVCVNHHDRYDVPYDPSTSMGPHDVHADPRFARDIDMLGVLVERLCDPCDHYDGIVVMTEGRFPPFSAQALQDAVTGQQAGDGSRVLPPVGFFLFIAGAIPADPTYTMTRHVAL